MNEPVAPDLTPMTKRKVREEKYTKKVKKLGFVSTYFTLFKGFVATGCLYLPRIFVNGGWGWQIIMLIVCGLFTMYCATLLLETGKKLKSTSFSEIGEKTYG